MLETRLAITVSLEGLALAAPIVGSGIILLGTIETALQEFTHTQKPDWDAINPIPEGELATETAPSLRGSMAAKQHADLSSCASPTASYLGSLLRGRPGEGPGLDQ